MDGQILWELFSAFESACVLLNRETDMAGKIKDIRDHLPPVAIGKNGGIMEWLTEREEAEPGHRHMSHLFALFPGSRITPGSPLAEGAKRTLRLRLRHGGGHTGWSRAWIINFWARLGDGNEANSHITELLRHSTLPNLFDDHPPFQIDGNFGAAAAIAHILLYSRGHTVYLLAALPDEWNVGFVTGICAKGGLVFDLTWKDGLLTDGQVTAKVSFSGKLVYNGTETDLHMEAGDCFQFTAGGWHKISEWL